MSSNASIISRLIQPGGDLISADETVAASGGVQSYATIAELPLVDNNAGDQAFVEENDRLYIWTGAGWYNIALINQAPNITSGGAGSYTLATDGTPTVVTLVAEDPEGIPITWSYQVTSGALGNTAVVQADNVFTITPSTNSDDQGIFTITFTASDGVNIATDVNSFSLTFSDDFFKNTVLLLQADDVTDGSQNNTFLDSSTNTHTITRNGNVTQGSFSPFSQDEGKWGVSLQSDTAYVTIADDPTLNLTGEFTIEVWYKQYSYGTNNSRIFQRGANSITGYCLLVRDDGTVKFGRTDEEIIGYNQNLSDGQWHHHAVTRDASNNVRIFFDGVLKDTATLSDSLTQSGALHIGAYPGGTSTNRIDGDFSNFRLVTGSALYTSNFTPSTTPLTDVSGTQVLTLQDNRFVDNSSNNLTVTPANGAAIIPSSPFAPSTAYNPATKGGSGYFSGSTNDQLNMNGESDFGFGTGDFLIETWFYPTNPAEVQILWDFRQLNSQADIVLSLDANTLVPRMNAANTTRITGSSLPAYTWHHFVLSRVSGSTRLFVNGSQDGATYSDSNSYSAHAGRPIFGNHAFNTTKYPASGYFSGLKVVKGSGVTSVTVPTAPSDPTGTSLLCNFTNAGIYDGTGRNVLETVGNAQVDTSVFKYGTGSMQFDGTGDYLLAPNSSEFDLSSGDFTFEGWFNLSSASGTDTICAVWAYSVSRRSYSFGLLNNGKIGFTYSTTGSNISENAGTTTISTGEWVHLAWSRSGNTFRGFINGVEDLNITLPTSLYSNTTDPLSIGTIGPNYGISMFHGYMDDLRITKGVARYTANFTPPAAKLANL